MKRNVVRIISLFLAALTLTYAFPLSVFAADASNAETKVNTDENVSVPTEEATSSEEQKPISLQKHSVSEIVERREANAKHFRRSDGSVTLVSYDEPVHYLDSTGVWQEIDNRLSVSSGYMVTGDQRVKFAAETANGKDLLTLQENGRKITLSLNGVGENTLGLAINPLKPFRISETELEKKATLHTLSSNIVYGDILDGVNLEYELHSRTVKENIIVKEKKESYRYTFDLHLTGLTATLEEDGSVLLRDGKTEEALYIMPAPVVFDAANVYAPSEASYFTLTAQGRQSYTLAVTVDTAWMNDSARVFPVTVDPAIGAVDMAGLADVYVHEAVPTYAYYSSEYMYVGSDVNQKECISYWKKSTLPTLPQNAYIVSASLDLYCTEYYDASSAANIAQKLVMLSPVTSAWPSSLSWNTRMSYGNAVSFANVKKTQSDQWFSFDITSLVRGWYDGTVANNGIALYEQTKNGAYVEFASYESGANHRPCFVVNYRDLKGIEPYLSYQTHDVGYAGTGAVNYATGALTFSIDTLTGTDALMPYTLSLTYNSSLAGLGCRYPNVQSPYIGMYAPCGFKLSTNETLAFKLIADETGATTQCYIYADADGTEHYFFCAKNENNLTISGQYADEDGLGLVLREVSASEVTITDSTGLIKRFTNMNYTPPSSGYSSGWRLTEIEDVSGNKAVITCNNQSNQIPILIETLPNGSSTAIEQMKIEYIDLRPAVIWNQATGHAIVLRYSATSTGELSSTSYQYLREVVYAYGPGRTAAQWQAFSRDASQSTGISVYASAAYTYDANGLLTSAKDITTGYEMRYTYTGGKVTQLTQYFGSTKGKTVGITYNAGETVTQGNLGINAYGSSTDVKTHYVLDGEGRTVSTYTTNKTGDTIYGAQSGAYSEDELSKNSLEHSVSVGGENVSYLYNGGFRNNGDGWTATTNVSFLANSKLSESGTAEIVAKANTTDSITQSVFLKSGTYTLTVNYIPHSTKNTTMRLKAVSTSSSSHSFSVEVPLNDLYASNGATEYSLTFNVQSLTGGGEYFNISVEVTGNTGVSNAIVTINHLVLARGIGAEKYSLVQFGSFENHAKTSSGTNYKTPSGVWSLGSYGSIATDSLFGNVLRISGSATASHKVSQTFTVNTQYERTEPKNFIVSAFGKLEGTVAKSDDSFFGIRVDVYNDDGGIVSHEFPFCESSDDWQFVSGSFTVDEKDVQKIVLYCAYDYLTSYAYFDHVSLVCDTDGAVVYNTYENGLLKKSTDGFNTTHYEYNEQKQVTRIANDRGQMTDYFYTGGGYLLEKEVVCTFTYTTGNSYVIQYPDNVDESRLNITLKNTTIYYYNDYGLLTKTRYGSAGKSSSGSIGIGGAAITTYKSYNTTPGSHIFGYVVTETDEHNKVTRYAYDQTKGYLLAVANPDEVSGIMYTYDNWGKITSMKAASVVTSGSAFTYTPQTDGETVNYTYDQKGLLSGLSTQSTDYTFAYNSFLMTRLNVGGVKRNGYSYSNQKLLYEDLPNSCRLNYVYDALGRVSKVRLMDMSGASTVTSDLYRYTYTDDGLLHRAEDVQNGQVTEYLYTTDGKLIGTHVSDSTTGTMLYGTNIGYDAQDRVSYATHGYDYSASGTTTYGTVGYYYHYDSLDRLSEYGADGYGNMDGKRTFGYDTFRRVNQINGTYTVGTQTLTQSESYTYDDSSASYLATGRVKSYQTKTGNAAAVTYTYTYDAKGNITKIVQSDGTNQYEYRYVYDDQNQLIREDNSRRNETYLYSYDRAGNRTSRKIYALTAAGTTPSSPKNTRTYTYGNDKWGDQLTAINGYASTFDSMGNPLTYHCGFAYTFTWEEGKYLASAAVSGTTVSYTYNENGIRTSKTVNGVKHTYTLNGSQIISEAWGNKLVVFLYDESGAPIGMQYRESTYPANEFDSFFYEKNLQGDIVGIFNKAGTRVVTYDYDAFGTPFVSCSSTYAWIDQINPFRYRGYYYDKETYLYYLNSRYYDYGTGRFISADNVMSSEDGTVLGYNLYAYCFNNPVNRFDAGGSWSEWIHKYIIEPAEALAEFFAGIAEDVKNYDSANDSEEAVWECNYFTSYNDAVVIKTPFEKSFSYGFIGLSRDHQNLESLNHEYGHYLQYKQKGWAAYTIGVAIPSVTISILDSQGNLHYDYYSYPWEAEANQLGDSTLAQEKPKLPQNRHDYYRSLFP